MFKYHSYLGRIVRETAKGTTINDDNLNDSRFDALWEKASELDFCFFIHPWDMQRGGCHEAFWSPWLTGNGEPNSSTSTVLSLKHTQTCSS